MKIEWSFFVKPWVPFIQGWFVPILVEIGQVVLEKNIFKLGKRIPWLSPLEKGCSSSFGKTWIIFTKGCFVPSLIEIDPVVLEEKMKMWKVYRRTDGQTDVRRSENLTSLEPSTQVSLRIWNNVEKIVFLASGYMHFTSKNIVMCACQRICKCCAKGV